MGTVRRNFGSNRQNMNLLHFCLILLLVLTVNGAPKPDPKPAPNPNPKAKGQMAIIFNNGRGPIDYSVHDYNGYGGPGGPSRRNGPEPEQNFGNSIGSQKTVHGNNQNVHWNNQIPYYHFPSYGHWGRRK